MRRREFYGRKQSAKINRQRMAAGEQATVVFQFTPALFLGAGLFCMYVRYMTGQLLILSND